MSHIVAPAKAPDQGQAERQRVQELLKAYYESAQEVRRGVCLLRAGAYERAETAFAAAMEINHADRSLPAYLAACLVARGDPAAAADRLAEAARGNESETVNQIRHALSLWSAGRGLEAVAALRAAIASNPECAELHFQLGTLLLMLDQEDEAELRFSQALSIDRSHTEALVSLAMCCGVRGAPGDAVKHLQRAQAIRPQDARIGLLMARAAAALDQQGKPVRIRARMPAVEPLDDKEDVEALSRVIETNTDFLEAFLTIPADKVGEHTFIVLVRALEALLKRYPRDARLHFQRGRLLERLGKADDAIRADERAVAIDPKFTRALIELAQLYARTDRMDDAVTRLEQAVAAGAQYADVYFLLGNAYVAQGLVGQARSAYRSALFINEDYEAAQAALSALST